MTVAESRWVVESGEGQDCICDSDGVWFADVLQGADDIVEMLNLRDEQLDKSKATISSLRRKVAELEKNLVGAYRRVDLEEGAPVVFLGVHAVRWQQEWGTPKVGFVEIDD